MYDLRVYEYYASVDVLKKPTSNTTFLGSQTETLHEVFDKREQAMGGIN